VNAAVWSIVVRAGPLSLIGAGRVTAGPDGLLAANAPAISTQAIAGTPRTVANLLILIGVLVVLDCGAALALSRPAQAERERRRGEAPSLWVLPSTD
jgi:hypothetical protein